MRILLTYTAHIFKRETAKLERSAFFNVNFTRGMSLFTAIPRNLQIVPDHGFDNFMEVEKKMCKFFRNLGPSSLSAQPSNLNFSPISPLSRHWHQAARNRRVLFCRLTRKANLQVGQERKVVIAQIPEAVTRPRKLLMMSKNGVELVERDKSLAVCAMEKAREKEHKEKVDAENVRYSFLINFPSGFKIGVFHRIAVWKWQRLPYWSPYEDVSGYDLRSIEAKKQMEKRVVSTIHELLSLTVEKKITLQRIAHFRTSMNLPKKLKDFLLQHRGIFYISTKGNLNTVFLREEYRKGELIEPNDLYFARRKLAEFVLLNPRKAKVDGELVCSRGGREDDDGDLWLMACASSSNYYQDLRVEIVGCKIGMDKMI
ncbi:hypothetical protein L6164_006104 [Bauhinia variegata]|uniref:Uncharacterized protein n=1 Tax=Bauhinia variegata TaxID=167791 RepID=A0ACB9PTA6_BAUVA|nr:hypothetical protein L6164_006104 [Bauhinia variegata]